MNPRLKIVILRPLARFSSRHSTADSKRYAIASPGMLCRLQTSAGIVLMFVTSHAHPQGWLPLYHFRTCRQCWAHKTRTRVRRGANNLRDAAPHRMYPKGAARLCSALAVQEQKATVASVHMFYILFSENISFLGSDIAVVSYRMIRLPLCKDCGSKRCTVQRKCCQYGETIGEICASTQHDCDACVISTQLLRTMCALCMHMQAFDEVLIKTGGPHA